MTLLSDEAVGFGPVKLMSDVDVGFANSGLQSDSDVGFGVPATHEDVMQAAGSEVLQQNIVRRKRGLKDLNTDETGAIMDAYKILGRQQPDKLRSQIATETAQRTQIARGILGDAGAAAFEAVTSHAPAIAGLVDPETGLRLKQGQQITANVNPESTVGFLTSMGVGLGKFALSGPVAIAEAGLSGAGEQRMTIAEARQQGEKIGGGAAFLETTARGIVDGVIARLFMKAGGGASQVVRSLIQPQVKAALAARGIDTARKLAWTWAVDSLKVGALSEVQYLADVGLGHLANPEIVPTKEEAAKAAAFGIALPSVMGVVHGVGGRLKGRPKEPPVYRPEDLGPRIPGTENYPIPPLAKTGGPLATIPGEGVRQGRIPLPAPSPADKIYPGESGPPTPRVLVPYPPEGSISTPEIVGLIGEAGRQMPPKTMTPTKTPGEKPETIRAAAIRFPDGRIAEGPTHAQALLYEAQRSGKTTDQLIYEANSAPKDGPDPGGFVTNTGRWLNTLEAAKLAEQQGLRKRPSDAPFVSEELRLEKGRPSAPTVTPTAKITASAQTADTPTESIKPAVPQSKAVVLNEADILSTPEGHTAATPHITYRVADRYSPAKGAEFGPSLTEAAGDNLWVRPSKDVGNKNRVLLVQFSNNLIKGDRPRTSTDDYGDKLYSTRSGYSRPSDFWELPQWIGVAAHNKPNSDVYVVRNMAEAAKFLADAKYGEIAFSALDVNSRFIQELLAGYKGKVAIGGYTDMAPFKGKPGVTVYGKMDDWIGPEFKDGTDYRHFRGTETQPRLQLSTGCLHKCGFCTMPHEITKTTPEGVKQQIKSFGDLNYRLVYLNDKTFGQADNYRDLVDLNAQIRKTNPNFEGFVIQTTAAQMTKFDPKFLADSGIKYVELGVESYNDSILKPLHKPANEKLIDEATQKIRENGLKLIPNVIVGLPEETAATYQRTLEYLRRNADVISHVNVNSLAVYSGTELAAKIGLIKPGDADETAIVKSFHKDPALHEEAYRAFTEVGSKTLDPPVGTSDQVLPEPPGPLQRLHENQGGAVPIATVGHMAAKIVAPIARMANDVTGEMAATVSHAESGKRVVRGLDRISTRAASLVGRIENQAADAYAKLSKAERYWLSNKDGEGFSNFQRLQEDTPSGRLAPPTKALQRISDAYKNMLDLTGQEAVRIGVQAITPKGEIIDFKQAGTGRYLRNMTPDAFLAILQGEGPLFEAIAGAVARHNKVTLTAAKDHLKEWLGPESVRKIGQLERLRVIKVLPTTVMVEGKPVDIQETDPYRAIVDNARRQAKRIYFIEEFGQNIQGKTTEIERLRAAYQAEGGRTADFDDLITVFEGRPYKRVFRDPRALISRAIRVVDTLVASSQTSLSSVPNLPQTMILMPKYVGTLNYLKAIGQVLAHPRLTIAQLTGLGAMNRSVIEWTLRAGHGPEDFAHIVRGIVARATGLEALSQFNNAVAGAGFQRLANTWKNMGIKSKDVGVARDLRLTPAEIAAVNRGQMTAEIYNKIVQNGVKITQFITEDPHRRSKLQNIPFLNALFAYNNYAIGTAKASLRMGRDVALALKSGDPKQTLAAAHRLVSMMVGAVGAGTVSVLLRRAVKGQQIIQPDETVGTIVGKALWEVSLLGPTQRMQDAYNYSGGTAEKALVNLSPKLSALATVVAALVGQGRWGDLPIQERVKKGITRVSPLLRGAENWGARVLHPQIHVYNQARSLASAYRPRKIEVPDTPVNPRYYHIHQAILRENEEELQAALGTYYKWATEQGQDDAEIRANLRIALMARRPINFNVATYREFLVSLTPEKRHLVETSQAYYTEMIDRLTLTEAEFAAKKGDLEPLRKAVQEQKMTPSKAREILKARDQAPLKTQILGLNSKDALRVWVTTTPEEKETIRIPLLKKLREARTRLTPAEFNALAAQYRIAGVLQ